MIKLIIFDLDGVLVDARELHYEALNSSIEFCTRIHNVSDSNKYIISRQEHLSTYDGLNTTKKLNMLTEKKGLPKEWHNAIWKYKQTATETLLNQMTIDENICSVLERLKSDGYELCVASNSIRESVKLMLLNKGFMKYISFFYSNEDVKNPKPNTEMYLKCMIKSNVSPRETLIIEDSHIGRTAALNSGAHLCAVRNTDDVSYEKIIESINYYSHKSNIKPKWQGGKMNVLIPMAGAGSRFEKAGYTFPKPLVEVKNKPMIQVITENLNIDAKHIYICQQSHYDKYNLKTLLNLISPNCEAVLIDGITEGAACTTLLAKHLIDNDEPLIIANSDQFVEWNSNEFMYSMIADTIDAGILTFTATHPKWSFAKLDENGYVMEVAEKNPISDIATVGIYYWKKGSDYVKYAEQMIKKDIRVNNEFYVCPVYNEAIQDGLKVKTFHINKMWGIGTPEDLHNFLENYDGEI